LIRTYYLNDYFEDVPSTKNHPLTDLDVKDTTMHKIKDSIKFKRDFATQQITVTKKDTRFFILNESKEQSA
jgi:hypothetical protein